MNSRRSHRSRWRQLLAGGIASLLLPVAQGAQGTQVTALDGYLQGLTTWSADFKQDIRDERGKKVEGGSGRLVIVRPGRFRWESSPEDWESLQEDAGEFAELMIADGRNVWFLDRDLEQATVKPFDEAVPQSPAMLLAGGTGLREAFEVAADGRRDGLEWVRVRPKAAESDFREALFAFRGRELSRLVVIDKLGQRSTLSFTGVRRNAPVDPKLMQFDPPEGVDLIGTPVAP